MHFMRIFAVGTALACALTIGWAQTAPAPADSAETAMTTTLTQLEGAEEGIAEAREGLTPVDRGDVLMARRRFREAIEEYEDGLHATAVIYNKIGIAYQQLGDERSALQNYRKALEFDPSYSEAINNMGTVYYGRKNYKRAISFYEQALEYAPNSASTYSNLGSAYFGRKQYDQAFEAYEKAISLNASIFDPSSAAGTILQQRTVEERATYHYYLAKSYAKNGIIDRALDSIRRALEEGFTDKDKFRNDPEFKDMQDLEEFQALMALEPRVL